MSHQGCQHIAVCPSACTVLQECAWTVNRAQPNMVLLLLLLLLLLVPCTLPMQFFFEEHVNFAPMLPYWGATIGEGTSLASSYAVFSDLRQHGVRAHSWV